MNYDYFYGSQVESYSFIRFPRLLMTGGGVQGPVHGCKDALRSAARPHGAVYAKRLAG